MTSYRRKALLGDQVTSAQLQTEREKRLLFSVGLWFGIGLGFRHDLGYWLGSEFRAHAHCTRAEKLKMISLSRDRSLATDLVKAVGVWT